MYPLLAVAAGSALGGVLRYLLSLAVHRHLDRSFPWGTLSVNVIGCFLMGVVAAVLMQRQESIELPRLFLMIGVLGGFTTFSSFSYETVLLLEQGALLRAAAYVATSVVLCLACTWLGLAAARQMT